MGLSSSSSKTTSNQTQNTNQVENATTTPVTPDWLTQAAQGYVGRIGSFGDMDPNSFVAPSSPLQNMAWQNAGSLGDWRQQAATASQMAAGAGQSGPNLAGTGGAMGRWAGMNGLTPNPQMSAGGGAQAAADALGGDKMQAMHSTPMAAPQNAFSGASPQQGPAYTYHAPQVANPAAPTAYGAQQTSLGAAPQVGGQSYQAPQLNMPGLVSGAGYSAPQLGNASGYAAARVGNPIGSTASTYQAPSIGPAQDAGAIGYDPRQIGTTQIAPTNLASASNADAASMLSNFDAYQNPYQQQVINTSLADFDHNAAVQQAQLEAQGARTGAFGGSRFGIAQADLLSDQGRSRAQLDAGIRSQGYDTAAGLAQSDAGLRQQTSLFNAQNDTGISQYNAGSANQRDLAQAQLGQQADTYNVDAQNASRVYNANAYNQTQATNAAAQNAQAQFQAQLAAQAGQYNAGALTQNSQFNAGQGLQASLAQAGLDTDAAKYGADMSNQYGLQQAGLNANALQFGAADQQQSALANQALAGQYGLAQAGLTADANKYGADSAMQAALANQNLQGQFGLSQFGVNSNAAAQYAGAQNTAGLAGYQGQLAQAQLQAQLAAAAGSQNATANNQMSQFNAGQADNAANRQLSAAGMLGGLANDYGTGTRADLGTMAQLGDQQRGIEQSYAMAGPAQLQLMGQLSGMTPYDILVGRNVNGTTNGSMIGSGTQVTNQTPSLFSSLLQAGQAAAAFM